jgi:ribulose-phosphate 3-epimerase
LPTRTFPFRSPGIRIAPSLLAADFSRLRDAVAAIEGRGADLLHLDVMDGHFVPNISFGAPVIESLRPHTKLFFDAHLMITDPLKYAEPFVKAGANNITFHIEVAPEPRKLVEHIRALGACVGVCLNPSTPASAIESIIDAVDIVLVMSVWPGFGGQKFMPEVLSKVTQIRERLAPHQRLEIDGGIDAETVGAAAEAGADTFVAGTSVFRTPDPVEAIRRLRERAIATSSGL